jgi:hypothetical protein
MQLTDILQFVFVSLIFFNATGVSVWNVHISNSSILRLVLIWSHIITCMSNSQWGFGFDIAFTDRLNTEPHLIIVPSLSSTLYKSLFHIHTNVFSICHQTFPGNGFLNWIFLSFRPHVLSERRLPSNFLCYN